MLFRLYVCGMIGILATSFFGCSLNSGSKSKGAGSTSLYCNSESCMKDICQYYKADINSSSEQSVCKIIGNCEIPNMPLTIQLAVPVHGDLACGPTSTSMALDSLITNTKPTLSGWMNTYSSIVASTSADDDGCPGSDLNCKKVVAIGNKLINGSWADDARAVAASEVSQFLETVKAEISPAATSFKTSVYPNDVAECDFVTGDHAITNSDIWNNMILYLNYEQITESTSTYSGAPLTEIKFKPSESGHFITMNGYNTTMSNIVYKFHCPIYGIKWYYLKQVKLNQPFCVNYSVNECTQYIRVTQLPEGFEDSNPTDSFTYIVEMPGEETAQNYIYKIIASISGIK
jgi:hypothetical protein